MSKPFSFLILLLCLVLLSSCYSIRLKTKHGSFEPKQVEGSHPFYKDKSFAVIDTTINLKVWEENGTFNLPCPNGIYSVEYKATFGNVLLSTITFGRKKKVKIKYVCIEEENME